MSDWQDVDLAEFEELRTEINNRTTISNQIIAVQIAAIGSGIIILDKSADVLLGLAAISTLLWLFWIDHTCQIYKIAAYIELEMAPRLRTSKPDLLGWERFLRKIDAGWEVSGIEGGTGKILTTQWVSTYTAALLGWGAVLLLGIYCLLKFPLLWFPWYPEGPVAPSILDGFRSITAVAVGGILLFAWRQYRLFTQTRDRFRDAILAAANKSANNTVPREVTPSAGASRVESANQEPGMEFEKSKGSPLSVAG